MERADTVDVVVAGMEFGKFVESCRGASIFPHTVDIPTQLFARSHKAEYDLLTDLTPLTDPTSVALTYTTFLIPILTIFSNTLSSLTSLIKRSLHKYTFLALSSYAALSSLQPQWDRLLARERRRITNSKKVYIR